MENKGGTIVDKQKNNRKKILLSTILGDYWIVGVLFLFILIFSIFAPGFLSLQSWLSTSVYAVQFILTAIGVTLVIITAGIDLSVGSTMGLSSIVSAYIMRSMLLAGYSDLAVIITGLAAGIFIGIGVGFLNGILVTKLKILPLIATLGTLSVAKGATFLLSDVSIANIPEVTGEFGNKVIAGFLPVPVLITLLLVVFFYLILHKTKFGKHTYAIGSNEQAARLAGINIDKHLIKIYMLSGFLASIAGLLTLMRFTAASPLTGNHLELHAIAAAVIGGASLTGGRGSIIGAVSGAAIISILVTGLILLNVDPYWQLVATGTVLVVAVYIDKQRGRSLKLAN